MACQAFFSWYSTFTSLEVCLRPSQDAPAHSSDLLIQGVLVLLHGGDQLLQGGLVALYSSTRHTDQHQ